MARIFRPSVVPLEDRIVPSVATPSIGVPEVEAVGALGTVPQEGNGTYTLPLWDGLHGYFATESAGEKPNVVFLGDSITYGWTSPDPQAHGSSVFAADFAPLGAQSYGIPGDETSSVLWRVENGELAGQPKVVVLMIGINDVIHGASASQVTSGILDDVSAIHTASPGSQVIVLGLLPTGNPDINQEVSSVDAALSQQTWGSSAAYMNVGGVLLGPDGVAAPGLLFDGLHPSAAGYQLLANELIGPITSRLDASTTTTTVTSTPATSTPVESETAAIQSIDILPTYFLPIDPSSGVTMPTTPSKPVAKPAPSILDSSQS